MENRMFQPMTRKVKTMKNEIKKAIDFIYSLENEEMNPNVTRAQMTTLVTLENVLRTLEEG